MRTNLKRLIREMAVIILMATVLGIAWNYRLLREVFLGQDSRSIQDTTSSAPAAIHTHTPLPLGLMQVKELFNSGEAIIIDARDREAFQKGHIRGAISIPLGEAEGLIPNLSRKTPKEKMLVVYCGGYDCHDSRLLGEKLLAAGFTQVFVYEGGYPEWQDGGNPVERGEE